MPNPKPPPDPDLARRVRAAIAYGPYKHKDIAKALGFEAGQLGRYLRAELPFDEAQLRTIAEMCNVSLRLLYEEFPPYDPGGELGRAVRGS
jgi:cytochrome c556